MKRAIYGLAVLVCVVAAGLAFLPAAALALPLLAIGATETTTNLNALMKITFDDVLIGEVVTDTELYDIFPDGEVISGPEGRHFETSQLYQNPGSIGARSENGYIPVPNGAKAKNAKINLKKIMGSLECTAEVLKKIKTDKAAFVNWAKEQFPRFKENLADELDRQALGDGSGIRARVNMGAPDKDGLVVDSTIGVAGFNQTLMQFQRGMHLRAAADAAGLTTRADVMTVVEIDWDNDAIIVDQLAAGLADNDFLFEGDAADNSLGKEMMGLLGLVDDGNIVETLQDIDRTEHLWFRSYVHDGTGVVLDEDQLIEVDKIARFRGGGRASHIITSEDAFNQVWRTLRADRSINDPRSYSGGRKGIDIMFGGTRTINLRTARKLPSSLVFGLQASEFRKFILHEWEWDDTTGSIWKQVVDNVGRKDAFYAYGSMYGELAIKSAQRSWRLDADLTATASSGS
jgi:hypothetical protein